MNEKSVLRKPAKMCYEHIGGKLGQLLVENFTEKGWIAKKLLEKSRNRDSKI